MNKYGEIYNNKNINKKVWIQDKIFDAIWNNKIDEFFENYKQFDEFLIQKSNSILAHWWHIFLDANVSWKLYSDFFDTFINSIKWIVGEDMFYRMWIFFEEKDYLLSNRQKMFDSDPYLDDKFQIILLWDQTVAQFIERRNAFNNVEFHYIIYPNRIFSFIDKLHKEHNIKL